MIANHHRVLLSCEGTRRKGKEMKTIILLPFALWQILINGYEDTTAILMMSVMALESLWMMWKGRKVCR